MASRDPANPPRRKHARTASAVFTDERSRALFPSTHPETAAMAGTSTLHHDGSSTSAGVFGPKTKDTASKIINTMRRQFTFSMSTKRRETDVYSRGRGMYSTPEERSPPIPTFRYFEALETRPTPEQIAMGLHLSRTPHLRPLGTSQSLPSGPGTYVPRIQTHIQRGSRSPHRQYQHSNRSASPPVHPPAPARSSLKTRRTDTSASTSPTTPTPLDSALDSASTVSLSASTAASTTPSTPRSSRALFPVKLSGVSRFLTGSRSSSTSYSSSSKRGSLMDSSSALGEGGMPGEGRRKSVRFTTNDS